MILSLWCILGYKQCNKARGEEDDPNTEECSDEEQDPDAGLPKDPEDFEPEVPTWPTPTGKTEDDAKKKCTASLTGSATFKTCKRVLGVKFNIQEAVEQCVADVLVRDHPQFTTKSPISLADYKVISILIGQSSWTAETSNINHQSEGNPNDIDRLLRPRATNSAVVIFELSLRHSFSKSWTRFFYGIKPVAKSKIW